MMGSLKNKRYQTAVPTNMAAPKRHYAGCMALCLVGALVLLVAYNRLNAPVANTAAIKPVATAMPAPTPNMPQRVFEVGKEAIRACAAISTECASVVLPSQHRTITTLERAALDVVYPASKPIPAGVDSACFWAAKYGVDCAEMKAVGDAYFKLNHPEVMEK